jgi:hypothetical protein
MKSVHYMPQHEYTMAALDSNENKVVRFIKAKKLQLLVTDIWKK